MRARYCFDSSASCRPLSFRMSSSFSRTYFVVRQGRTTKSCRSAVVGRLASGSRGREERVLERLLLLGRARAVPERGERALHVSVIVVRREPVHEGGDRRRVVLELGRLRLEVVEFTGLRRVTAPQQ